MDIRALDSYRQELRRGVLVIACLEALRVRDYGYGVLARLGDARLSVEGNTVYPLLRRLEAQGALTSTWDRSGARARRYYATTPDGAALGDELLRSFRELAESVDALRGARA
jgi:PadR family transcriptional regulator PadR